LAVLAGVSEHLRVVGLDRAAVREVGILLVALRASASDVHAARAQRNIAGTLAPLAVRVEGPGTDM
jgi:hypothetical protein